MIQGPLVGDSGFRRSWDLDSNSFISWCPMDTIAWSKFRTFIWKGLLISKYLNRRNSQTSRLNKWIIFFQTITLCAHNRHTCVFIVCFPGLERKISVRTSKEELIQRGILLPAEVRLYFSFIIIDYFWLLLILIVAVYYGLLLIVYDPKKAFFLQRRDYTS